MHEHYENEHTDKKVALHIGLVICLILLLFTYLRTKDKPQSVNTLNFVQVKCIPSSKASICWGEVSAPPDFAAVLSFGIHGPSGNDPGKARLIYIPNFNHAAIWRTADWVYEQNKLPHLRQIMLLSRERKPLSVINVDFN